MNELDISYALAKKVPDMARGFRIETRYGELEIEAGALADRIAKLVRAELEKQLSEVKA